MINSAIIYKRSLGNLDLINAYNSYNLAEFFDLNN